MENIPLSSELQPIATAPADGELELSIYDKGEYHALVFPCRPDGSGWHDVRANRSMPLEMKLPRRPRPRAKILNIDGCFQAKLTRPHERGGN